MSSSSWAQVSNSECTHVETREPEDELHVDSLRKWMYIAVKPVISPASEQDQHRPMYDAFVREGRIG